MVRRWITRKCRVCFKMYKHPDKHFLATGHYP